VIVDVKTGEIVKKMRGFGATNGIFADGKLILLDDNGMLVLAEVSSGEINIVSKTKLLDSVTWTPPTLVGSTLYVRDREYLLAIDLG